jgi:hypothetical protein
MFFKQSEYDFNAWLYYVNAIGKDYLEKFLC